MSGPTKKEIAAVSAFIDNASSKGLSGALVNYPMDGGPAALQELHDDAAQTISDFEEALNEFMGDHDLEWS